MCTCSSKVIVLADPPVSRYTAQVTAFPNIGLSYLASALRQRFPECNIRYLDCMVSPRDHIELIRQTRPAIYGLSFASPYATPAAKILNAVKAASPTTTVICGGAHPSSAPELVLRESGADVACVGEGEVTACEIAERVFRGCDFKDVAGIVYRTSSGLVAKTHTRPLVRELDSLSPPAWDLVDFHRFSGMRTSRGIISTAIVASRGCPYDCVFCSNPVWKIDKPWFRKRSAADVAAEVETLYRRGVREVYLRSDEMNADVDWAISVFETLAGLNHDDLVFQCNLRATPVTPRLVDAMAHAHCWLCHVGIESASQRVLDGIRKRIVASDIPDAFALIKSRGIKIFGFFMLYQAWEEDGALCVESSREVMSSLRFILNLRTRNLIDYISWAFATPYPRSALYHTAMKHGLNRRREWQSDVVLPWDISMDLPGISRWEMAGMRVFGMLLQGALVLSDRDSYNSRTMLVNLRVAADRLRYLAHV